jgi:DNA-binding NtrC family response regulator
MAVAPILVVDDEADMRTALSQALSRGGFKVESTAGGSEAVLKIKKNKYSLLITDMKMPDMTGLELLTAVKNISPRLPVIMITAYGTVSNAVEAVQAGASDYILKPFSFETLDAAVKKSIGNFGSGNHNSHNRKHADSPSITKAIITNDPDFIELLEVARNVADSNATVLIQGESGTGKELLAGFIHSQSDRKNGPYVALNCAALPENLAESELFGHEKGSFTGAVNRKLGKFELAKQGTIVLDEISEMALPLQAKLLRVLQEREIDRVGGSQSIPIDARVIAISNLDLKQAVAEGKFREDLYYRINVVPLSIAPLRERKTDIPLLAEHFLAKFSSINKRKVTRISDEALSMLLQHDWKGNVRELENAIERAILIGCDDVIMPEHLILAEAQKPSASGKQQGIKVGLTVREMEKELIVKTLENVNENRTRAAELLGISIRTLRNKLREYRQEAALG